MTVVTLHPLEVVPESELAELSAEVFGDERPSELLAEVLAAEAVARGGQADEKTQHTFRQPGPGVLPLALRLVLKVQPKLAICLGKATYNAVRAAFGRQPYRWLRTALKRPMTQHRIKFVCLPHPSRLGELAATRESRETIASLWRKAARAAGMASNPSLKRRPAMAAHRLAAPGHRCKLSMFLPHRPRDA